MCLNTAVVWIDLHELIRLKPVFLASCHYVNGCRDWSVWIDTIETTQHVALTAAFHEPVGIDLPELIRLKQGYEPHIWGYDASCRDWSAWIDTIETRQLSESPRHVVLESGLICLNWYDWNSQLVKSSFFTSFESGLICLIWYDWNPISIPSNSYSTSVEIDLPDLFKRKFLVMPE